VRELLARVEAVLRRSPERPAPVAQLKLPRQPRGLRAAGIRFEDGQRAELSEREVELLHYFAAHRGRALSREELLLRVWRIEPQNHSESRTIDMHIANLRAKLRDETRSAPRLLLTVREKVTCSPRHDPRTPPLRMADLRRVCIGLFLVAMLWVSQRTLAMDRARESAERESTACPLADGLPGGRAVSFVKNSRPMGHYQAFRSPGSSVRATRTQREIAEGQTVTPSPLLGQPPGVRATAFPGRPGGWQDAVHQPASPHRQ